MYFLQTILSGKMNFMRGSIQSVIFFGTLAILSILAIQGYLMKQTWDLEERKFNQKVVVALVNVAQSLSKHEGSSPLSQRNLISQISQDYFVVNYNDVIDARWLEFYLLKELDKVGLHDDFEYGIYDCGSDRMVYGNYVNYADITATPKQPSLKRGGLAKYDKFIYYFGVRFPERTSHLLNGLRMMGVFAVILLATIFFFAYALTTLIRQKRLTEMQKDFINNMTHEFKTPISTIKISSDVFLNHPLIQNDKRLVKYASIISDQNDRLNHQVEKVLQLARIERDGFKLNLEDINLHELLQDIVLSAQLKAADLGGNITLSLDPAEPFVKADRLHLTNVIHNLLDNAIKYHRGVPSIVAKTSVSQDKVLLEIADEGIGIPKEHQQKIFDKFFRIPTGNVHNVKGFGLGLYYVKNICDAHAWKLTVQSEPARGTTISILMPPVLTETED